MKLFKITALVGLATLVTACEDLQMTENGPDKTFDRGLDKKHLSQLEAGIWVDPNGCDHWIIDDGVEACLFRCGSSYVHCGRFQEGCHRHHRRPGLILTYPIRFQRGWSVLHCGPFFYAATGNARGHALSLNSQRLKGLAFAPI
jgi:hypothetical protein